MSHDLLPVHLLNHAPPPQNKEEVDREELKPVMAGRPSGAKRGRPTSRGVSKMSGSEGRANGRRAELPPSLPNGESEGGHWEWAGLLDQLITPVCLSDTPRRRTRRTSGVYDSDRVSNGEPTSCFLPPPPSPFLMAVGLLQRILGTLQRTVKEKNPPTRSCLHGDSGMTRPCRKRAWSRRRTWTRSHTRWLPTGRR